MKDSQSMIIIYNSKNKTFDYSYIRQSNFFNAEFDNRPLWDIFEKDNITNKNTAKCISNDIQRLSGSDEAKTIVKTYNLTNGFGEQNSYKFIYVSIPQQTITISIAAIENLGTINILTDDNLPGLSQLFDKNSFCTNVELILSENPEKAAAGEYAVVYFDILHFKAVNDMFGTEEGDRLLAYIAQVINSTVGSRGFGYHITSDRFAFFVHCFGDALQELINGFISSITQYDLHIKISCNLGIYVTNAEKLSANAMLDRASLAHSAIKGNYTIKYNYYTEELRKSLLTEQEITGSMSDALENNEFLVYYQPQYNHSTGNMIGTEALIRWKHPERGLISPAVFIPIFEKNGFIATADLYVFEQVCIFIRKCLDKNMTIVPISSNFSRHDIFLSNFVGRLEEIRTKYDVPVKYLRVEITESAIVGGSEYVNNIVKQLHERGYIVEMDDFGSAYSSLNVLKDIDLDMLKLDLKFLANENESNRSGTILSSIVRMAKWLSMPVIAEGVETVKQADFLRSIGCDYIQGYLYSKPLPEEEYLKLLSSSTVGAAVPQMRLIETLNACNFWDPASRETLIFSNFVGGAAIFDYHNGQPEILRVNEKYVKELAMNLSEKEIIKSDLFDMLDEDNRQIYKEMLQKAIDSGEEQECETWRSIKSKCCGEDKMCIRTTVRMVGKSKDSYLFYAMIRNITSEKKQINAILTSEKRFKMASEQANIYYWEYTIDTKEMRPCFRCMRDLGLPALVRNYPEPAIDAGIIPQDYADMYRHWHVRLEQGVRELEAIIPLTVGRVPFHVKYTTEFDVSGKPVKAYGSATYIINKKEIETFIREKTE